jgi:hypothetical protein
MRRRYREVFYNYLKDRAAKELAPGYHVNLRAVHQDAVIGFLRDRTDILLFPNDTTRRI